MFVPKNLSLVVYLLTDGHRWPQQHRASTLGAQKGFRSRRRREANTAYPKMPPQYYSEEVDYLRYPRSYRPGRAEDEEPGYRRCPSSPEDSISSPDADRAQGARPANQDFNHACKAWLTGGTKFYLSMKRTISY